MSRLTIPVKLRWSDIDAYQHVNNARMFTILEETRIAAFWASVPGDAHRAEVDRAATADGADRPDDAAAAGDGHSDAADDRPGTRVLDTGPGSGTNTYIARQEIEYLEAVPYSLEPLPVQLWISHLGGASIDICYEIAGRSGPAVRAMTTLVLVDEASGRPRRMSEAERASWLEFVDEPLIFRRRRGE